MAKPGPLAQAPYVTGVGHNLARSIHESCLFNTARRNVCSLGNETPLHSGGGSPGARWG